MSFILSFRRSPPPKIVPSGNTPLGIPKLSANPPNAGAHLDTSRPADPFVPSAADLKADPWQWREFLNQPPAPAAAEHETVESPIEVKTVAPAASQSPLPTALSDHSSNITASQEIPVATSTAVPANAPNGFEKVLKNIGKFFAKAIPVLGVIQSTPEVQAAEKLALGPTLAGLIDKVITTAVTVEASSAAAATNASDAALTDTQKAAIVVASITNDAQTVATQLGASALTQADIKVINDAAIAIAGVFKVPASL